MKAETGLCRAGVTRTISILPSFFSLAGYFRFKVHFSFYAGTYKNASMAFLVGKMLITLKILVLASEV
jgi:hypothetical protein